MTWDELALPRETLEAIENVMKVARLLFGDPPTLDWDVLLHVKAHGVEITVRLFEERRRRASLGRFTLTEAGIRGGLGELPPLIVRLRDLKRRVILEQQMCTIEARMEVR